MNNISFKPVSDPNEHLLTLARDLEVKTTKSTIHRISEIIKNHQDTITMGTYDALSNAFDIAKERHVKSKTYDQTEFETTREKIAKIMKSRPEMISVEKRPASVPVSKTILGFMQDINKDQSKRPASAPPEVSYQSGDLNDSQFQDISTSEAQEKYDEGLRAHINATMTNSKAQALEFFKEAEMLYRDALEMGHLQSGVQLTQLLISRDKEKDPQKLFQAFSKGDNKFDKLGLAICYHEGIGVQANRKESMRLLSEIVNEFDDDEKYELLVDAAMEHLT